MSAIHVTALIDPAAELDDSVCVGAYSVIGSGVTVASGTVIDSHVVISGNTSIGHDNHIHSFALLGDIPQDMKYRGGKTRLKIGNGNRIREFTAINLGTEADRGETTIGDDNLIMSHVHVGHDCIIGNHCIIAGYSGLSGHVVISDYAILGGRTGIHQHCQIGSHSICAMHSMVLKDIPAFVRVAGAPAEAKGLNVEGLRRCGASDEVMRALKQAYRIIYMRGLKLDEAVSRAAPLARGVDEVALMLESIEQSQRGIVRPKSQVGTGA